MNLLFSRPLPGKVTVILLACFVLAACTGKPQGVEPVKGFEKERYLGKWHEIARLDHSFEEGLSRVTADYTLREDGGVKVVNRGYSREDQEWSEATGKAYFVEDETTAWLKVSFFGPFYGSYIVFELGENYDYSFVSGPDKSYLWLLARSPRVEPALVEAFIAKSEALGFDTSELIFVDHPSAND
ncbi:lipocalin family protein [Marinobacter sp.]